MGKLVIFLIYVLNFILKLIEKLSLTFEYNDEFVNKFLESIVNCEFYEKDKAAKTNFGIGVWVLITEFENFNEFIEYSQHRFTESDLVFTPLSKLDNKEIIEKSINSPDQVILLLSNKQSRKNIECKITITQRMIQLYDIDYEVLKFINRIK